MNPLTGTLLRASTARRTHDLWDATWTRVEAATPVQGSLLAAFHVTAAAAITDATPGDLGETALAVLTWAGDLAIDDPEMAALIVRSAAQTLRARLHEIEGTHP